MLPDTVPPGGGVDDVGERPLGGLGRAREEAGAGGDEQQEHEATAGETRRRQIVVVTEVLDGQPGCWLVRKRWLVHGDRLMCLNAGLAEQSAPAAMRQAAA